MTPKIKIENLYKSFGEKQILSGVDLEIQQGEILCLIGKSGSGKSVLMKHLIGIFSSDKGDISIDEKRYSQLDELELFELQTKCGILFQGAALFDSMNIFDNIAFGLRRQNTPEEEIKKIVSEMLENVGLKNIENKYPSEISGGMQKRVGLARSIAIKPEIMLYDEPTTGVDPITAAAVDRLIVKMNKTYGITSIVVSHDLKSIYRIADRIAMLYQGKIIFTGKVDEIQNSDNPILQQFIKGEAHGPIKIS